MRDTTYDLDHIILDAMLEGFDTGASCAENCSPHMHDGKLFVRSFVCVCTHACQVEPRLIPHDMWFQWGSCFLA